MHEHKVTQLRRVLPAARCVGDDSKALLCCCGGVCKGGRGPGCRECCRRCEEGRRQELAAVQWGCRCRHVCGCWSGCGCCSGELGGGAAHSANAAASSVGRADPPFYYHTTA